MTDGVDHAPDLGAVLLDDHVADPLETERAQGLALVRLAADRGLLLLDLELCHQDDTSCGDAPRGTSARALSSAAGATSLDGQATASRHGLGLLEHLQRLDRRVHDVDLVGRAERLAQHVVDAGALEHRAHRATGDHTGTGSGRTQQDDAGRLLALDRVRDGALDAGDAEEVLLGLLDTLGDRRGHLLGLAVADADHAVAVADDHEGGEAEATTTLHDLGDTVDRDDALDVGGLVSSLAAATVVAAAAALATARCPRWGPLMRLSSSLSA